MLYKFTITYETVSQESAEQAEAIDFGFVGEDGELYSMNSRETMLLAATNTFAMRFSTAIGLARSLGIIYDEHATEFYAPDPDIDWKTAYHTTYTMHPLGVPERNYQRIGKILKCRSSWKC